MIVGGPGTGKAVASAVLPSASSNCTTFRSASVWLSRGAYKEGANDGSARKLPAAPSTRPARVGLLSARIIVSNQRGRTETASYALKTKVALWGTARPLSLGACVQRLSDYRCAVCLWTVDGALMKKSIGAFLATIVIGIGIIGTGQVEAKPTNTPNMTPVTQYANDDPYPPGCVNKTSFDACAIQGLGCSLGTRRACREICEGLCNQRQGR